MEGMEQWSHEAKQWLQRGIEYAQQIPPNQLYAAAAVLLITTLLLVIGKPLPLLCNFVSVISALNCEMFDFFLVLFLLGDLQLVNWRTQTF